MRNQNQLNQRLDSIIQKAGLSIQREFLQSTPSRVDLFGVINLIELRDILEQQEYCDTCNSGNRFPLKDKLIELSYKSYC